MHPEATILEEGDARVLLAVRRPQHVQLDHRRVVGVDLHDQLHRIARYAFQHQLLVRRQNRVVDVDGFVADYYVGLDG